MKIMVCGAIGFGDISKIREIYRMLNKEGFDVLDHIDQNHMDYSRIKNFRIKKNLAKKIVEQDLKYVKQADVLIVIFSEKASYGSAIEMYFAKNVGKKVILFVKGKIPTPWAVSYSDYIIDDEKELLNLLNELRD